MTVADIQQHIDADGPRPGAVYLASKPRGLLLVAWESELAGCRGWWWALVRRDRDVLVRYAFSVGARRARDRDVTAALRALAGDAAGAPS